MRPTRTVLEWSSISDSPISLAAIETLHQPRECFRVSPYAYACGEEFDGATREARVYCLTGSFTVEQAMGSTRLADGQFADIPRGKYRIRVEGSTLVESVWVWDLRMLAPDVD